MPAISLSPTDTRILSRGILQISTSYTRNTDTFNSTCSAVLVHTPEPSLNYCVALTAANCFDNIPSNAMHVVEMVDGKGNVVKSYRVSDVTQHPEFRSLSGQQTTLQAAVDVAIVEFKCALPSAIQPSRILDISKLAEGSRLMLASYKRVEPPAEKEDFVSLLTGLFVQKEKPAPMLKLEQSHVQFQGFEIAPMPLLPTTEAPKATLNIDDSSGRNPCDGQSGGPVFFEKDNELFLVGTASSGAGFCDKNKFRYAATSLHTLWLNTTLKTKKFSTVDPSLAGEQNKSYDSALELPLPAPARVADLARDVHIEPAKVVPLLPEIPLEHATVVTPLPEPTIPTELPKGRNKKPSDTDKNSRKNSRYTQESKPKQKKVSLAAKKPLPVSYDSEFENTDSNDFIAPDSNLNNNDPTQTSHSSPAKEEKVPPIPPPPLAETDDACMGVRLVAQSKSRVWGTVIKLIDKESSLITDESLKCELANGQTLCVVSNPVPTGSGESRAVLSQNITQSGCTKFYSGRMIYLTAPDFEVGQ